METQEWTQESPARRGWVVVALIIVGLLVAGLIWTQLHHKFYSSVCGPRNGQQVCCQTQDNGKVACDTVKPSP